MQAELRPGRGGDVAAEPWIAEVLELAGNPPESPDVAARVPGVGQAAGQIGGPWPGRGDAGRDKADQDGHVEGDRMAGPRAGAGPGAAAAEPSGSSVRAVPGVTSPCRSRPAGSIRFPA